MKALIVYDARGEQTPVDVMAAQIAEGLREGGLRVELRTCDAVNLAEVQAADALILGCPSHYGNVSAAMKAFIDRTYELHGALDGKVGAGFTSARHVGGGMETTLLTMHISFLIHGMIVQGDTKAAHYGPFVVEVPGEEPMVDDSDQARRLGRRVAALVKRLAG